MTKRLLFCTLSLLLLIACGQQKTPGLYTIGIVQTNDDSLLDSARQECLATLASEGYIDGKTIKVIYRSAQGDISNIQLILNHFISSKVDMVITITTPCTAAATQTVKNIPVVFFVAFSPAQVGIRDVPANIYGQYNPLDMSEFIAMIRTAIPSLSSIGIVYNPAEANARFGADKLTAECARQQIRLEAVTIASTNDVLQAGQSLARKNVDAFAVISDNSVYLALDALVKVAESQKIPLFVSDPIMAERGASGGLGMDYRMWGREGGKLAAAIIRGNPPAGEHITPLTHPAMWLNIKAAASQGLTFPPELKARAEKVIQ